MIQSSVVNSNLRKSTMRVARPFSLAIVLRVDFVLTISDPDRSHEVLNTERNEMKGLQEYE